MNKKSGEVEIITMEPQHIRELAAIHMNAFRGYSNTKIGKNYVRKFLKWFVDFPDGIALTALFEGVPAGYVVGARVGYQTKMNKELAGTAAIGFLSHPWVILNKTILSIGLSRLKVLFNRKNVTKDNSTDESTTISLVGIAVSPSLGGLKIGSSLMSKFEEIALKKGFTAMRLSVYNDNNAALRLYKKSGWKEFSSKNKTITFVKELGV